MKAKLTTAHIQITAPDKDSGAAFAEMCGRISRLLGAFWVYSNTLNDLDENAPECAEKAAMAVEQLMMKTMSIYPFPAIFEADMDSMANISADGLKTVPQNFTGIDLTGGKSH